MEMQIYIWAKYRKLPALVCDGDSNIYMGQTLWYNGSYVMEIHVWAKLDTGSYVSPGGTHEW